MAEERDRASELARTVLEQAWTSADHGGIEYDQEMAATIILNALQSATRAALEAAAQYVQDCIERRKSHLGWDSSSWSNEEVDELLNGLRDHILSLAPVAAPEAPREKVMRIWNEAVEKARLAYEAHTMKATQEPYDPDTCETCGRNFRHGVHLRIGETKEQRIAELTSGAAKQPESGR